MHKLSDLNAYGAEYVGYADNRPYGIVFHLNIAATVVEIQEDQPHLFIATWDIDDMSSVDTTGDTIDVNFTLPDVATNFVYFTDTAPAGITLTDNGSGSYTVSGIDTMGDWAWVKAHAAIKPEADKNTSWTYQVEIDPPAGVDPKTWTITVNYAGDGEELSDPLDQEFDPGITESISGHPTVTDPYNTDESIYSYRVVISSDDNSLISNITSSGTGGSTTWSSSSQEYTIQGTKTQVNSHLETLQLDTTRQTDWTLTYTLTNLASSTLTVKTQNWVETVLNAESTNLGVARNYTSNTFNEIYAVDPVQIDDGTITGSPVYTVKLTLGADIGVICQRDDTVFPPAEWSAGTLTWTYTGTEAECNTALTKIAFAPTKNVSTSTTLKYQQWRDTTIQADATVALTGSVRTTAIPGANTYTFTSDATFTPSFEQANYLDYQVLVVAGGGGGGSYAFNQNASDTHYSYESSTGTYYYISGGGGAGAVNFDQSIYNIFKNASGSDQFAIVVGSGGAHGYTPANVTSGWYPATDGGSSSITRTADSRLLVEAFGGWGGKSIGSTGYGMGITGRTYAQFGRSGYYTVSLNEGGYYTSSSTAPSTTIENLGTYMPKAPHPYTITGGGAVNWLYASTHQFYLGAEASVVSDIDGTSRRYGGGGTLRYYNESGDFYTYPGSGGFAGLYDTGNNGAVGAPAVDQGYTDGQPGIVIIKFTQPS